MTIPKPPTPQGISALLKRAGFEKAIVTNNSRYVKENTEGFHVGKFPGGVVVTHWTKSAPPSERTTAHVQAERERERGMVTRYAEAIRLAGWRVKESAIGHLVVDTHPEPVPDEPPKETGQ
jgi:hypothetical protein